MAEILQKFYKEYKDAVKENSAFVSQCESVFRLVSYAISGRFEDATILSELLYSASNLLVLFNDAIIKKAHGILPIVTTSKEKLQRLVTVLEYIGVFVELAVARVFGEPGRWVAITALQIAKCVCRFLLFHQYQCGIQPVPPITPMDREAVIKQAKTKHPQEGEKNTNAENNNDADKEVLPYGHSSLPPKSFTLQRSGKVMRSLSAAVPIKSRDWKVPPSQTPLTTATNETADTDPSELSDMQRFGEYLYIVKPLVHLVSLYTCGQASFKPWILSSSMDVTSLYLARRGGALKQHEQTELRRRTFMLFLYLLRSPMYDKYTKERLLKFLRSLADRVPGLSLLIIPVIDYLPVWQQIYFYTWST